MRQKIWCDRWIVKFRKKNFTIKYSLSRERKEQFLFGFRSPAAPMIDCLSGAFFILLRGQAQEYDMGLTVYCVITCRVDPLFIYYYHIPTCFLAFWFDLATHRPRQSPAGRPPHHAMLLSRRCAVCLALRHLAVVEPVLDNPWGPYESRQIRMVIKS